MRGASLPPPQHRHQALPRALPSLGFKAGGKGTGRRRGAGVLKLAGARVFPARPSPAPPRPVRRKRRGEGADSPETARRRPGAPNMSVPIPGKLPGVSGGGGGAPETFPHSFHHPPLPPLLPGTLFPTPHRGSRPFQGRGEARGGARAARVTCRESFQLPGRFPTPRAGPQGAAGSALRGCLFTGFRARLPQLPQLGLRSGPPPRLALPTPGPHWQRESPPLRVFPKAPSSRAPAPAAPSAPLPARCRGCPGTRGGKRCAPGSSSPGWVQAGGS